MMKKGVRTWIRATPACSPAGMLLLAAILTASFLVVRGLGLADYASVLSGSPPPEATSIETAAAFGAAYVLLYMATVIVVPILILGAAIFFVLQRRLSRRCDVADPDSESVRVRANDQGP